MEEQKKRLGEWTWRERIVIVDSLLDTVLDRVRGEDRELVHMMRYCIQKLEERYPPLDEDRIVGKFEGATLRVRAAEYGGKNT